MTAEEIIAKTIKNEGGFVCDSSDHGGATKYGITEKTARRHGFTGPMIELPLETAVDIYRGEYWKYDEVLELSPELAARLFDFGVTAGPGTAVEILQSALSALSGQVVIADGILGPKSVKVLQTVLKSRRNADKILLKTVEAGICLHYVTIVNRDETQQKFIFGWLSRLWLN